MPYTMSRRELMKVGALAIGGTAAATMLPMGRLTAAADGGPRSPFVPPFMRELPIPAAAKPYRTTSDTDFYRITAKRATAEIIPGRQTEIWAYDGMFPGPTILASYGRRTVVDHSNRLFGIQQVFRPKAELDPVHTNPNGSTAVHLHGALVDGDSDGHPDDEIALGATKQYAYCNHNIAFEKNRVLPGDRPTDLAEATPRILWYHDHNMETTGQNVYHGLAAFYLIDYRADSILDDTVDPLTLATSKALPQGEFDVPLMIADRLFNGDGSLNFIWPDQADKGILGDTMLVNGAVQPFMPVQRALYRFKILNAGTARVLELKLSNGMPLTVIGNDGGYLETPVTTRTLMIAPAERYEIVIDFRQAAAGSRIVLENALGEQPSTSQIMRFDVGGKVADSGSVPPRMRTIAPIPLGEVAVKRHVEFARQGGRWRINDRGWAPEELEFAPRSGDTELWTLENGGGGWTHPIHIHLLDFQVLSRTRRPVQPYERGWKDTIFLGPNEVAQVIMRWPDVPADERVPVPGLSTRFQRTYPFHCHNLQHEDNDMMRQIMVLDRNQATPGNLVVDDHSSH